jgi:hypothetical protein
MPKLTLNTIGSRYGSIDALNDNFDSIEVAVEKTLSRDGTSPNGMEANLDMGGNSILNANTVNMNTLVVGGTNLNSQVAAAAASAAAALASENAATASEAVANSQAAFVTSSVAAITPSVARFSGNDVTTAFTLPSTPGAEENTLVFVGGVYQQKDTYSISGTTLTFSEAPVAGTDNIEVQIGPAVQMSLDSAAGVSYLPAGSGAVTTTVAEKLREHVSVRDFGAVGDGVADDTAAIQAALNAAIASKRVLHFPGGVYLTETLSLGGDVGMTGFATLKLKNATNDHLLDNDSGGGISVDIRDMTFDGNYANQTAWAAMLNFAEVDAVSFIGCTVRNIYGAGFEVSGLNDRVIIQNCLFEGNRDHSGVLNENPVFVSIRGTPTTDAQIVTITDNVFIGEVPAVANHGAGGIIITNNTGGTNVLGPKCTITGNTFYTCGQDAAGNKIGAITLYRAAAYSSVCNNRILTCYENGIDIQGSFAPVVTDNYVENARIFGIVFAPRDLGAIQCSSGIIEGNVIKGADVGITVYGGPPAPTADAEHVIISNNIVRNVDKFLAVNDYLGSISVTNNIFETSSSTGTGDQSAISFIGSRDSGTQSIAGRILFANNIVNDLLSFVYFAEWSLPISISGNLISNCDKTPALFLLTNTASVNITGNQFKNCKGFLTAQACDMGVDVSSNTFENSMGVVRGVSFDSLVAGSLTVLNGNVFKNCDNDIVNYGNAAGRNLCVNNISDAGGTIRISGSTVTQANNLFA